MPKYGRLKNMEDSNGASGEDPEYGAIFMSNNSTRKECLRREIFGLPIGKAGFVKQVKAGMMLFLFEFESRELHGVFEACSDGAINIEPNAFPLSGKQFPAQVRFTEKWHCRPLRESEFRHAIRENYFTAKKFNFGLSKCQVQRLLELFSLKKVERSLLRETAASKPTRKSESKLGNTVGDCSFGNRYAGEADRDIDSEIPVRVDEGDLCGRRLTENYGSRDESDIGLDYDPTKGIEYPRDTSGVYRRLGDSKLHGSKDRVGYDFNMSNSFGTYALTNDSDSSLVIDRRVANNLRHTASGWLEKECYGKDGIQQASSWSNDKERLNFEADPVVPAQSSVPLDLPYGENRRYCDPCQPGIMGDATMKSSRHDLDAPNFDLMGSSSFTANSNHGLREDISAGGYVSEALPSETLQSVHNEHNGTSNNNTSSPGVDYYIPMPIEYHTNSGMIGVACSGSESESRPGHLHYSQYPGLLTSARDTENIRNFKTLSYSGHSIYPSFAYSLSSRDLSRDDGNNNEIPAYRQQEEIGGHVSSSNDIYPSFRYRSTLADGVDLHPESRTKNEVQAYQRDENLSCDAFNNSRVSQMKDDVKPAELKRKSVFSRLAMPSKERDAEKETSPDSKSVDEVMASLNNCHKHWMEQKKQNMRNSVDFGIPKRKKEKFHTVKVLDNDLVLPSTETTPTDLLDCEESTEDCAQKLPFIDFKRRSKSQKSSGNLTQGYKDSPNHSAPQNKKRKLLRPKLIVDDSQKDVGKNDGPIENILALQAVNEVPAHDFRGRIKDDSEKKIRNNDDAVKNVLASQSATEVPLHDFPGHGEEDSEKNLRNNDDSMKNALASQLATEVPVPDLRGRDEDDSEKNTRNNDDPIKNLLASQSTTEVPVHGVRGDDEGDSEKTISNNDDPLKNVMVSQSATEVPVHDFRGHDGDDSEKNINNNDDPVKNVLASQSATEVPFHDFHGRDEDYSEKNIRNNDDPMKHVFASATEVPFHDFFGRDEGDSEKDRGNNDGLIENVLASQSVTEVPFQDFFARDGL